MKSELVRMNKHGSQGQWMMVAGQDRHSKAIKWDMRDVGSSQ
jgi:hypothetical protein